MICSMTAFAREQVESGAHTLIVELRSVNHRYLDCSFKMPDSLRVLEPSWRELSKAAVARGKLEIQLRIQSGSSTATGMQVNEEQLTALLGACEQIREQMNNPRDISPLEVLRWPGVISDTQLSAQDLQSDATAVLRSALATLVENRQREGAKLAEFIGERIDQVQAEVDRTREIMPQLMAQQQQRLQQRLDALAVDVDPGRLEQELVFMAHKADVDEELDRLQAHVEEVRRTLAKGGPCGRRLDFLMQELNREANTLSSKSIASSSSQNAVELKVLIEQMREQIQNIE